MNLIELVLSLAVVGFVVYLILLIPMPSIFKNVIAGIVCFALVIWLLQSFGLIGSFHGIRLK